MTARSAGRAESETVEGGPSIVPFGDAALLAVFGDAVDPTLSRRAQALARAVESKGAGGEGWGAPVPAYASVLVPFDPLAVPLAEAMRRLEAIAAAAAEDVAEAVAQAPDAADTILIDVRYGGEDGPDLEDVARRTGLTPAEVVATHTAAAYQVYFLGFAPGFGYLGPLPEQLRLSRRDLPRVRVPAGSVAIAGAQTAIYPLETPGGWHLIGRTSAVLWDADRDPPAMLRAGRSVRFRAVDGAGDRGAGG